MSNVLIKESVNMAELFGDRERERTVKTKMLTPESLLWKIIHDLFDKKEILNFTELLHWQRKLWKQSVDISSFTVLIQANLST